MLNMTMLYSLNSHSIPKLVFCLVTQYIVYRPVSITVNRSAHQKPHIAAACHQECQQSPEKKNSLLTNTSADQLGCQSGGSRRHPNSLLHIDTLFDGH